MEENEVEKVEEATEVVESVVEEEKKPAGYEPVDFKTATPEQIDTRFRYVYRQAKDAQEENKRLNAQFRELQAKVDKFEGNIEVQNAQREIEHLESQRKEARLSGDDDRLDKINDKIAELRAEQKVAARLKAQEKPAKQETQENYDFNQEDHDAVNHWASEISDDGRFVRPWAQPTHPQYRTAFSLLQQISADPQLANRSVEEHLQILERKMNKQAPSTQTVMGKGKAANSQKPANSGLSLDEQNVALKLYSGPRYAKMTKEQKLQKYSDSKKRSA